MSSRNAPPNLDALASLHDIQQEYGAANVVVAIKNFLSGATRDAYPDLYASLLDYMGRFTLPEVLQAFDIIMKDDLAAPKWVTGHELLRNDPSKWFRVTQIDDRDLALINASHGSIPWVKFGKTFLFEVRHKLKDQPYTEVSWDRENDEALGGMISEVGAEFTGFATPPVRHPGRDWLGMFIAIAVSVNIESGTDIGLFLGRPSKARVFAGPRETVCCDALCKNCTGYAWDIMIVRDAWLNQGFDGVPSIESRQYDILLMKFCGEAFEYPWFVLAVKDSGPNEEPKASF